MNRLDNKTFEQVTLTHSDARARQGFQRIRQQFIQELIDSLSKRFPDDQVSVIAALAKVFDVTRYPAVGLDTFARNEMATLSQHFAAVINVEIEIEIEKKNLHL